MEQETVVLNEGSSDHNPILLTVWTGSRTPDTITCRSTDWEQYRILLQSDATPIPRQALVSSTKVTTKLYIPYYVLGIPEETKQLIRDRRRAKIIAMRTGAPADKNRLNRRVKAALDDHRGNQWQEHLESLNPEDRIMWKTCRALRQKRKSIPAFHGNNGIVYEKRGKAFTDPLDRQFQENDIDDDDADAWENIVNRRDRKSCDTSTSARHQDGT